MGNTLCNEDTAQRGGSLTDPNYVPRDQDYEQCPPNDAKKSQAQAEKFFDAQPGFKTWASKYEWKKRIGKNEYYLGDWANHIRRGKGILLVSDKYAYYGTFDGLPHGKGKLVYTQHKITFQGEVDKGKIKGEGTVIHHNRQFEFTGKILNNKPVSGKLVVYRQQVDNSHDANSYERQNQTKYVKRFTVILSERLNEKSIIEYEDGRHYEGQVETKHFLPDRTGTMTFVDKSSYEGYWKNGKYHGQGTFTWPDGSSYFGDYENGLKHGTGTFTYPSKKVYHGQWRNGKQDGHGQLFNEKKELIQKGIWRQGNFQTDTQNLEKKSKSKLLA